MNSMQTGEKRKLFTGGEWLVLLGVILVVLSPALVWTREAPRIAPGFEAIGAVFVSRRNYLQIGYDLRLGWMSVGWAVIFCAVASGAMLLFEPGERRRALFLAAQLVLGGLIVALALLHIGPYPGSILALVGGLMLLWGAFARYRSQAGHAEP